MKTATREHPVKEQKLAGGTPAVQPKKVSIEYCTM